jgi:hypothetical protein
MVHRRLRCRCLPTFVAAAIHVFSLQMLSNFSREIKILGSELDEHFGVPVVVHVEALTEALRNALHAELPDLLRGLPGIAAPLPSPPESMSGRVNARPVGPRPRRATPSAH